MKKYLLTATFGIGLLLSSQAHAACGKNRCRCDDLGV